MRHLHAPDETDGGSQGHGGVDSQGHRRDRRVHVDDAERVLLLIVRRRQDQATVERYQHRQHGRGRRTTAPNGAAKPYTHGGDTEAMEPGPVHALNAYSSPMRTAAAAASGASVTPSTAIAPNKYIGGAIARR